MKKQLFQLLFACLLLCSANLWSQVHKLPELSYAFNALEPHIDSTTMNIHYSRHHAAYVNNLNNLIKDTDQEKLSLEALMHNISKYSAGVRNNGGGHYNHTLFWSILTPIQDTKPSPALAKAINATFGSMDSLKIALEKAGATRFGSGWAWLSVDNNNKLFVSSTANQDNPLMDVVEQRGTPILGIDVWEHAYYLKYQNKRAEYLSNIWAIINWDEVSRRYAAAVKTVKMKKK